MLTTVASSSTACEKPKSESSAPPIDTTAPTIGMPAATKPPKTKNMTRKVSGRAMPSPRSRSRSTVVVMAVITLLVLPTEPWASIAVATASRRGLGLGLGRGLGGLVEAGLEVDDRDEAARGRGPALEQRRHRRVGDTASARAAETARS